MSFVHIVTGASIFSAVFLVLGLLGVPLFVASLPPDLYTRAALPPLVRLNPTLRLLLAVVRNLVGGVLVLLGLLMLVLPGQGILTILLGLMLMDFPGKRRLELSLLRRPAVLSAMNWMRRRAGKPEFLLPDNPHEKKPKG